MADTSETLEILARLVAFASVTDRANGAIADWIAGYLVDTGAAVRRVAGADGKVGLLARVGPAADGGALLSAHMDVVPAAGQAWSREPFQLSSDGGRLYGRGTTDMKGFLACALAAAKAASRSRLARPLLLSLSYDEEIGCRGIREMIGHVVPTLGRPAFCVVGEPTNMQIAIGHKGKVALNAECRGEAGHSASAPRFLNALHLAAPFVMLLKDEQDRLACEGSRDADYDVPYSTVHAGRAAGGIALNIVPDTAIVEFEIRHLAGEDPAAIAGRIREGAARIVSATAHPAAAIGITEINGYPGLAVPPDDPVVATMRALCEPGVQLTKVGYGTEAGFFRSAGIPTVVCGPGNMAQGHQPDEFIERSELDRCGAFLSRLVGNLAD